MQATAIHTTNAAENAADYRMTARLDASAPADVPMTTREFLTAIRNERRSDGLDDNARGAALLRRAQDAARLSMVGVMYSTEDRADCAAEVVWTILATMPGLRQGAAPAADDPRCDLSTLRGMAQNFRRSLDRKRADQKRTIQEQRAQRAAGWSDALDSLNLDTADDPADTAADAATAAVRHLGLPSGGAVWSALYLVTRQATAEVCAAELGIAAGSMRARCHSGRIAIRTLYPDPAELLDALTGSHSGRAASGELIYSVGEERHNAPYRGAEPITPPWREGTNAGEPPIRAADRESADSLCTLSTTYPRPMTRKIARRGMWRGFSTGRTTHLYRLPRRSKLQAMADARRTLARLTRPTRDRGVDYNAAEYRR